MEKAKTCQLCGLRFTISGHCTRGIGRYHRHKMVPDFKHCVYCGLVFSRMGTCSRSHDKKHWQS